MKKKIFIIIIFLLCLLLFPTLGVSAREKESLENFSGKSELWNSLPDEVDQSLLQELLDESSTNSFSEKLWNSILSFLSVGIQEGLSMLAKLCALLLFAALFQALKDSFGFTLGESALGFLLPLCTSFIVFSSLQSCLTLASRTIQAVHSFFLASLPVTTILLTLSGSPSAAGTMASSLSFAITSVSTLISVYLSPLLNTLFAFSALDGILDSGLSGFLAFLRKTVKVLCVLFFIVISATLALQNALATAADSVAMRSVRFAAGTFIPIVGSLVGESSKTLAASFSAVKAECGVLCLLVLLYVSLRPILYIAVQKLFIGLANAFAQLLGEKTMQGFLNSLSGLLDLLQALIISQGCYLVFYVTLFITNRGGA